MKRIVQKEEKETIMNRFTTKNKIINQLIGMVCMLMILFLLSFVISNFIAKYTIIENSDKSSEKILLQVVNKIDNYYLEMNNVITALAYSPTTKTYINGDKLDRLLLRQDLVDVFNNTLLLQDSIIGISLYDLEGDQIINYGKNVTMGEGVTLDRKTIYSGLEYSDEWNDYYYTITMPIYNLKSYKFGDQIGEYIVVIDVTDLVNLLDNSQITKNTEMMLVDGNNKVITYCGRSRQVGDGIDTDEYQNNSEIVYKEHTFEKTGWKIINMIPTKELYSDFNIIQKFNIAAYIILMVLLSLFLFISYKIILKPINQLIHFVKNHIKKPEDRIKLEVHNEVSELAYNLNKMFDDIDAMGRQIRESTEQMYELKVSQKNAELMAYRSQINPHFLYNTFECIRSMAYYYEADEIADITMALSKMFRYAIKGSEKVTVEDEMNSIAEYAKIIKYRFGGKIRIDTYAEEEVKNYSIMKLCIQPLVENAVFHGLEPCVHEGGVKVLVIQRNEQLIINIEDNGIGISEDRLNDIKMDLFRVQSDTDSKEKTNQGVGLDNIFKRIQLTYGNEAEFSIESKENVGTKIVIRINKEVV